MTAIWQNINRKEPKFLVSREKKEQTRVKVKANRVKLFILYNMNLFFISFETLVLLLLLLLCHSFDHTLHQGKNEAHQQPNKLVKLNEILWIFHNIYNLCRTFYYCRNGIKWNKTNKNDNKLLLKTNFWSEHIVEQK